MSSNYCPNCGYSTLVGTGHTWGKGDELRCTSCDKVHHVCEEQRDQPTQNKEPKND